MTRNNKGYRNLRAWELANKLTHKIYDITENFPKAETFGLISQMRRAALSVPTNIAEGYSRKTAKDRKHFYIMANSSLTELEYYIDFVHERNLYSTQVYQKLADLRSETARVLTGLIKSVKI